MLMSFSCCSHCSHVKNLFISKMKHGFFCTFQSANPEFVHQYHVFSFYVPSHMHLQTCCAPSNDFSVLMVLIQWLFWFIHIGFFFTLLQSLLASCRSFLPDSTHTYTPFSNTIMNRMEWLKSKNLYYVTTDWWKLVKKKQDEMEKMSCAVTYNGESMVEAGIGSEKFLRIRILEILRKLRFSGHRHSILIASCTSPHS